MAHLLEADQGDGPVPLDPEGERENVLWVEAQIHREAKCLSRRQGGRLTGLRHRESKRGSLPSCVERSRG